MSVVLRTCVFAVYVSRSSELDDSLIRLIHNSTSNGHLGNKHKKPNVKNFQKNNIQKEKVCPSGTDMRCGDNRGSIIGLCVQVLDGQTFSFLFL